MYKHTFLERFYLLIFLREKVQVRRGAKREGTSRLSAELRA